MSEKSFDFSAKWDEAENRRFLEALKRKKIEFCKEHGLPVPAFDKEEDFFVTPDMFAWAQGSEGQPTSKCEGSWKCADHTGESELTRPCGAYVPKESVQADKKILDVTCGARTIWFDKHHPAAIYCDRRREEYRHLWKNAGNCSLSIDPDVLCDFTDLPFPDNAFPLVVFDPPHLTGAKETAWLVKKYGKLDDT